jgi:hypothetical protein
MNRICKKSNIESIIICYDSVQKVTEFRNEGVNDFMLFFYIIC